MGSGWRSSEQRLKQDVEGDLTVGPTCQRRAREENGSGLSRKGEERRVLAGPTRAAWKGKEGGKENGPGCWLG